ncbi:cutinase family protein [Actinomadura rugatobispora]|uniref:Cutinase family protein n=1 Tax=Actinomadura rugatobispora TaxID=1994 RepID=A0ABW1AJL1_9ACTN|nr:cutinase family protein [Actinomadura rugatobispora]
MRWISAGLTAALAFAGGVGLAPGAAAAECKAVSVISARGTTEPQSGSWLQKPIGDRILAEVPDGEFTELTYPADFSGGSPGTGVTNLVNLLNAEAQQCPGQKYVLMGYSQGAIVTGDALVPPDRRRAGKEAGEISAAAGGRIAAVLLYGDPGFTAGEPFNVGDFDPAEQAAAPRVKGVFDVYASRIQNYCVKDDFACQGTTGNFLAHLGYFFNGMPVDGAAFAVQKVKG